MRRESCFYLQAHKDQYPTWETLEQTLLGRRKQR